MLSFGDLYMVQEIMFVKDLKPTVFAFLDVVFKEQFGGLAFSCPIKQDELDVLWAEFLKGKGLDE